MSEPTNDERPQKGNYVSHALSIALALIAIVVSVFSYVEARRAGDEAVRSNDIAEEQIAAQMRTVWRVSTRDLKLRFSSIDPTIVIQSITLKLPPIFSDWDFGVGGTDYVANISTAIPNIEKEYNERLDREGPESGLVGFDIPIVVMSRYTVRGEVRVDNSIYILGIGFFGEPGDCTLAVNLGNVTFQRHLAEDENSDVALEEARHAKMWDMRLSAGMYARSEKCAAIHLVPPPSSTTT
ncbi:MAG: hypothetical protein ACYC0C_12980 [Devosia sp.]